MKSRSTESPLRTARLLCAAVLLIYPLFWVVSNHFRQGIVDPWPPYVAIEATALGLLLGLFKSRWLMRRYYLSGLTLLVAITAHTFFLLIRNDFHQMYMVSTMGLVMIASAVYRYTLPTQAVALAYLSGVSACALVMESLAPSSNLNYFVVLLIAFCVLALVVIRSQIRREQALETSEERFRQLSEASLEGVAMLRNGAIIDTNTPLLHLLGFSRAELLGWSLTDLVNDDSKPALLRYLRGHSPTPTVEANARGAAGELIVLEINCRELSHEGEFLEVAVLREITARKRFVETLQQEKRLAEAENRAKSHFLAQMSHELRTPLNAIIGFSELLSIGAIGELSELQLELVHDILRSGEHLLSLINDILDLSKIEAGKMGVAVSTVALPTLLRDAMTVMRQQAAEKGVTLELTCELPEMVTLDGLKLKQVLLNLLSNAVKFTDRGGAVTLRGWMDTEQDTELIALQVRDTGIGIAPADLERIFRPFEQVETSLARNYDGTGLGLALVARLVDLLGGRVTAQSKVGHGSCFEVRLPCVLAAAVDATTAEATSNAVGQGEHEQARSGD